MYIFARFVAAVLFLLAALGFFEWIVHLTIAHSLGLLAAGLLVTVLAEIIARSPRA